MRAIKIDSMHRTITVIEQNSLEDMQSVVGGKITIAYDYPDGSTCFVNDEGLFDQPQHFFASKYGENPFAGNGIIVGPTDEYGNTLPCNLDLDEVINTTHFLTIREVRALYDL